MKIRIYFYIQVFFLLIIAGIVKAEKSNVCVSDFLNQKDYTIIYFLSLKECTSCYDGKIKFMNNSFSKKYNVQFVYVYYEKLSQKEIRFMNKKYKSNYIFSKDDNIFENTYFSNSSPNMMIINKVGDILYNGFPLDESIKEIININQHTLINKIDIKLKNDLLFSAKNIIYNNNDNILYVFDNVQSSILLISMIDGGIINTINIVDSVDNFFLINDTLLELKKKYQEKGVIKTFYFDSKNRINVIYQVQEIQLEIEENIKNNNFDSTIIIYPKTLLVKYYSDSIFSITPFENNNQYQFDFDKSIYQNNRLYLVCHKHFNNIDELMHEDANETFFLASFDTNFSDIKYEYSISDIPITTQKKYYSIFAPVFINKNDKFIFFSDLNTIFFSVDNLNKKTRLVKPFGTMALYFNYNSSKGITPKKILTKKMKALDFPYYVSDLLYNNDTIFVLFHYYDNHNIVYSKIQLYDTNGDFINEILLKNEKNKKILEMKFVRVNDNKLEFLIKYENLGWKIQFIIL